MEDIDGGLHPAVDGQSLDDDDDDDDDRIFKCKPVKRWNNIMTVSKN